MQSLDALQPDVLSLSNKITVFGAFAKFQKAAVSFVMSVCPFARNNSATIGRIFMKFDIWIGLFFETP
jgi:hypothetical protein